MNDWLAAKITTAVGSMWCAYAFAALALLSLPDAIQGGRQALVSWVAQTFLQLVLLSVILVGQRVQAAATEARDAQDHAAIMEELEIARDERDELGEILAEVHLTLQRIR